MTSKTITPCERIYVLELRNNKFYIGKTSRPILARFREHQKGSGAAFTMINPPLKVCEVKEVTSSLDEDYVTKSYMMRYGIDNVRGGSYANPVLLGSQLDSLEREFRMANSACLKCGNVGHFAKNCRQKPSFRDYDTENVSTPQISPDLLRIPEVANYYHKYLRSV